MPASAEQEPQPWTQEGRVALYSSHRRWIDLPSGQQETAHEETPPPDDPTAATVKALMAQLCEFLYRQGWATGTGGGVSIQVVSPQVQEQQPSGNVLSSFFRQKRPAQPAPPTTRIFVAPSGIQKEDLVGVDMFEMDVAGDIVKKPTNPKARPSACTPLWYVVYQERPSARCVIHTHSMNAVMATLLDESAKTLKITHLEMLKGVGGHAYDEVLEIPIIDNRPTEDQLADQLREAVIQYPRCNCVLVRRHGLYVWGDSWQQAKTFCESFDYVLDCAIRMRQELKLDPALPPQAGTQTYRITGSSSHKRQRISDDDDTCGCEGSADGFRGLTGVVSSAQQPQKQQGAPAPVPLLPRDAKILLLDIEGCTTSISFVHDELFPYCRRNVRSFVSKRYTNNPALALKAALLKDVKESLSDTSKQLAKPTFSGKGSLVDQVVEIVLWLMDHDIKSPALKDLQGQMWQEGYTRGELKGHVYSDVSFLFSWMKVMKVKIYIYSSGSVQAQKLLFGYSNRGDLLPFLSGHFDIPSAGNKRKAESYRRIAEKLSVDPSAIVFVSDLDAELEAAREAGIGWTVQSIRPGNAPIAGNNNFPTVESLMQLCGEV